MWQNILFNPDWQILRSGWRLLLFAGLVTFTLNLRSEFQNPN